MNDRVAVPNKEGHERRRDDLVLSALSELCEELEGGARGGPVGPSRAPEWPPVAMPREEDQVLLAGFRGGLARLADAVRRQPGEASEAVRAVLDGAQLTVRTEILTGRGEDVPDLLASFCYLLVLQVRDEPEAGRVAKRAAQLVGEATLP